METGDRQREKECVGEYEGSSDRQQKKLKMKQAKVSMWSESWRGVLSVGFLSLYKDPRNIMD